MIFLVIIYNWILEGVNSSIFTTSSNNHYGPTLFHFGMRYILDLGNCEMILVY